MQQQTEAATNPKKERKGKEKKSRRKTLKTKMEHMFRFTNYTICNRDNYTQH